VTPVQRTWFSEIDLAAMSSLLPGSRELPRSQYNLDTYWGRVRESAGISDPRSVSRGFRAWRDVLRIHIRRGWSYSHSFSLRMLLVSSAGLEHAKRLLSSYKQGETKDMTPELWYAKRVVDSTLHPGTLLAIWLHIFHCRLPIIHIPCPHLREQTRTTETD
jgi:sideroflexin-5